MINHRSNISITTSSAAVVQLNPSKCAQYLNQYTHTKHVFVTAQYLTMRKIREQRIKQVFKKKEAKKWMHKCAPKIYTSTKYFHCENICVCIERRMLAISMRYAVSYVALSAWYFIFVPRICSVFVSHTDDRQRFRKKGLSKAVY